jgi:hypothetical protein
LIQFFLIENYDQLLEEHDVALNLETICSVSQLKNKHKNKNFMRKEKEKPNAEKYTRVRE